MNDDPSGSAPTPADYDNTESVVLKQTGQSLFTLGPLGIGVLGACAVASPFAAVGFVIGGIGCSAASWFINHRLNADKLALRYRESLHKRFDDYRIVQLRALARALREAECVQGEEQLGQFDTGFKALAEVLHRKLSTQELTYSRYMSNAESIYRSGVKNLEKVIDLLTSVRDIKIEDARKKSAKLSRIAARSESQDRELSAFKEREKIYDNVQEQVASLLAENEDALTTLNKAAVAAANIETTSEMEMAMSELKRLAEKQLAPKAASLL